MPDPKDPYAAFAEPVGKPAAKPTGADPYAAFAAPVESAPAEAPAPDEWRKTDFGFRVKPTVTHNGQPSVQREDGLVWYGPQQGNTGRPGWFDAKGMRGPNMPVKTFTELATNPDAGVGLVDRLLNRQQEFKGRVDQQGVLKTALQEAGNQSVLPTAPGTLIRQIRESLGYKKPAAVESYLPDPTGARVVKGALDTAIAPVQLVANAVGPASAGAGMNQFVTNEQQWMDQNFRPSVSGEMIGQALPFILTGGASAEAQAASKAPTLLSRAGAVAKGAGTGAILAPALTPEANVETPGDYWGRKGRETVAGATIGSVPGVIAPVVERLSQKGTNLAPEAVNQWFKDRVPGRASDVLQEDLAAQYQAARRRGAAPFQALRASGDQLPMDSYIKSLDEAIAGVQKSGFSDKEKLVAQLEKLKATATDGPTGWDKALDIGTDLNNKIADAMSGQNPDRNLARILEQAKQGHQQALDEAGAKFGDLYKQAKETWKREVVPWEDPREGGRLLKSFINSPTPDQAMAALLKAKSEDKLNIFVSKLSKDKGIPALQAGLVDSVYQQSLNEGGKVIPEKFLGALKQRMDAYNLAFDGEAKWRMDGVAKLLRDARFTAQALTGEWLRHIPGGRVLPGSAYATPGAGSILQKLFTSPTGQKLLYRAQSLEPGSAAMGKLIEQDLPKLLGAETKNVVPFNRTPAPLPASAQNEQPDRIAQQ